MPAAALSPGRLPAARSARRRPAWPRALVLALLAWTGGLPAPAAQPAVALPLPDEVQGETEDAAARSGAAPTEAGPDRSLVLVVDTSGSMAVNDPTARIRQAVGEVVGGLPDRDVVGLVTFDTGARVVAPLRRLDEPGARGSLAAAVQGLRFTGRYTDIAEAVERALYELTRPGREGGPRLIVLVTDGLIDTGDAGEDAEKDGWLRDDLLPSCREEGIRIFSVAFTESADYELLRTMSTRTGGGYYRALTPDDVPGIFSELERALNRPPPAEPAPPPAVPAKEIEQAVEKAVRQVEAERPSPAEPAESGPSTAVLALFGLLAAAALVVAALALRRVRRADREALPVVQARLHDLESGTVYELGSRVTRIGRAPDSEVVIDSPTVSGQHALIEARDGIYYLVDLRSTNGTFVNEHRIERETVLRKGDVIRFDRFKFAFDGLELDEEATQVTSDSEHTVVRVSPWADRDED